MFLSRAIELKGLDLTTYSMGIGLGLCHGKKRAVQQDGNLQCSGQSTVKGPWCCGNICFLYSNMTCFFI